jgi:hypothetical protein
MKKILVVLLALAFAATLFSACGGGNNGGGGGSGWMSAGLARSVDKQFGPVTLGTNGAKKGEVIPATLANDQDGGTHQVNALKGKVNKDAVLEVARFIDEEISPPWLWPPVGSPLPGKKADLVSQLSTLASRHSVDNNPCEDDLDMNGIPTVKEPYCSWADPNCTDPGLCDDPASVKCTQSGKTFDIKFSDCARNYATTSTYTTWTVTNSSTGTTVLSCNGSWQVNCNTAINTQTVTPFTTWSTTSTNTNFVRASGGPSTITTVTDCGSSNQLKGTWTTTTSTYVTGTTCGHPVEITNCSNATTTVASATINTAVTWTSGHTTTLTSAWSSADIWDGAVALNYGVSNVDEQLYHTRYNKLTKVWDQDGTGNGLDTVDNAPFVVLSGEKMEYRVVDPGGWMTGGTTSRYKNVLTQPFPFPYGQENMPDGMEIDRLNVQVDHDGKSGTVFPTGKYTAKRGEDWEDGMFAFSDGGSAIVKFYGATFISGDTTGEVFDLNFFDKDNPGNYLCETAQGTPCVVQVHIGYTTRLLDILSSTCADVKPDTGIKY